MFLRSSISGSLFDTLRMRERDRLHAKNYFSSPIFDTMDNFVHLLGSRTLMAAINQSKLTVFTLLCMLFCCLQLNASQLHLVSNLSNLFRIKVLSLM